MNLANKITLVRIFVIPIVVVLYILGFYVDTVHFDVILGGANVNMAFLISAAVVYALAACTDFVDGNIARKTNTVTSLGKFLDPIADKVLVVVMLVLIIGMRVLPEPYASVMIGLIFAREFIVGALRQIAVSKGFVLAADVWGKLKTVFTDIAVGLLMLAPIHTFFYHSGMLFFAVAFVLTIYSGYNYIWKNRAVFSEKMPEVLSEGYHGEADKAEQTADSETDGE